MGYKQPPKFTFSDGSTVATTTVRVPDYLAKEIEAYAKWLHSYRQKSEKRQALYFYNPETGEMEKVTKQDSTS